MLSRLKAVIALMRNPKVSKFPKFLVIGAILYLLMPFDFIPDAVPVIGWLDDITFLVGAISLLLRAGARAEPTPPGQGQIIDVTPEPPKAR